MERGVMRMPFKLCRNQGREWRARAKVFLRANTRTGTAVMLAINTNLIVNLLFKCAIRTRCNNNIMGGYLIKISHTFMLFALLLSFGCAPSRVWVNPSKNGDEAQKDFRECQYDANKSSYTPYGDGRSPISAGVQEGFQSVTLMNDCMRLRGYYLVNKYQHEAEVAQNTNTVNAINEAIKQNDFSKALEISNTLIANNPNDVRAHMSRGNVYYLQGKFNDAIAEYNLIITQYPKHASAFSMKAVCFAEIGEFDIAVELANMSIDMIKNNEQFHNNRAAVFNKKGNFDKAIDDCNKAIALNSSRPNPYRQKGLAFYGKEQYDKSLAEFNKAIAIDITYDKAYLGRGETYLKTGKLKNATADFKKACELGNKESCQKIK